MKDTNSTFLIKTIWKLLNFVLRQKMYNKKCKCKGLEPLFTHVKYYFPHLPLQILLFILLLSTIMLPGCYLSPPHADSAVGSLYNDTACVISAHSHCRIFSFSILILPVFIRDIFLPLQLWCLYDISPCRVWVFASLSNTVFPAVYKLLPFLFLILKGGSGRAESETTSALNLQQSGAVCCQILDTAAHPAMERNCADPTAAKL